MKSFLIKLLGFSIGPVIGALIAFITIPITTYFVNPDEYGKASMFMLAQTLVVTFIYLGLDQAYTREYHSQKDKMKLFQNVIFLPLLLATVVFIYIVTFRGKISSILFGSSEYVIPSVLFGLMIIFMILERFILLSIRMKEKAFEYSFFSILIKLTILLATLVFVIFIRTDFLAVVYSTIIGQIVGDLYLIIRYHKLLAFRNFALDTIILKRMLIFGFPLLISAGLTGILNAFDRISLRIWSDFTQIGIFTATLKIAAVLAIVQQSFTSFWVPTAYRWLEEHKDIKHFKVISDLTLLGMSLLMTLILTFKDVLVPLLSTEYSTAKFLIAFLCFQPILYTLSETTCLGIVYSRKSYLTLWVALMTIIPNITLNILLVPKFGAYGAAIATGVSYLFFFISRSYFSFKNGMEISIKKHLLVILLLYAGAFINMFDIENMFFYNLLLLMTVFIFQIGTVKQIFIIKTNKDQWDFT
ncbi:oligosaccharide flippase family protein [Shouchella clausii]|uniref:oligosaccharide flippase family protein n=1 Tax=Shouchella clausii TaxID=79880 RepID=UPI000BA755C7|nr:oligosaccharide flippase family protein [Shouchella clausii]PAE96539.1 polysaccharide biosynthesis protein [Shouchella clausii]